MGSEEDGAAAIPGARVLEVAGDHFACVRAADRFVPALIEACRYVTGAGAAASVRRDAKRIRARPAPREDGRRRLLERFRLTESPTAGDTWRRRSATSDTARS